MYSIRSNRNRYLLFHACVCNRASDLSRNAYGIARAVGTRIGRCVKGAVIEDIALANRILVTRACSMPSGTSASVIRTMPMVA